MTRMLALWLAALFLFCAPQQLDFPQIDPDVKKEMKSYLQTHYMTPEDYVLSKFKDHDIVFLGEHHRYKHDVELVQHLIPRLYENGIYALATEFARREDQPLIDRLLNAPTYDESLARQITFNGFVFWGYQDYVDLFKVAWKLNHGVPKSKRKFRILGVNCSPDWSVIQKDEDRDSSAVMKRVWRGCGEEDWARVILDEIVARGEKALVYSGMHHAFTEYRQPKFNEAKQAFAGFGDVRMGNHVYRAIGKRAITIYLHAVWSPAGGYGKPPVYAADGYIDAVMAAMEPKFRRIAFDTRGTPFGKVPGQTSIYKHGYEKFTLEMFCDGYIYQKPLSEYKGVHAIHNFVNEKNIAQARLQSPAPRYRNASIADFNQAIAKDVQENLSSIRSALDNYHRSAVSQRD